jgi:hypothetical protein
LPGGGNLLTPALNISGGAPAVSLNWPAPANAHALQQIADLSKTKWAVVTNQTNLIGGQNQVNLSVAASNASFCRYP